MSLKARISQVKAVRFIEAFEAYTGRLIQAPTKILCPIHDEKTASFWLQENRWHCFGCGEGGDIIDLVGHLEGVEFIEALVLAEDALGLTPDDPDSALRASCSLAKKVSVGKDSITMDDWSDKVDLIEEWFLWRVLPYLRCIDPLVGQIAWRDADYVFEHLDIERDLIPRTPRLRRHTLRDLWVWGGGWVNGIESSVERMTGKDILDVAFQSPAHNPMFSPSGSSHL